MIEHGAAEGPARAGPGGRASGRQPAARRRRAPVPAPAAPDRRHARAAAAGSTS